MQEREIIEVNKISEFAWEIPKTGKMNVPGIVYASDKLMEKMREDRTLMQLRNVAMLPGILKHAIAMPDAHEGYGFPIGGVAAFDLEKGIISPGGVGYDINCLTGDTKVLDNNGQYQEISKLAKNCTEEEIFVGNLVMKKLKQVELKTLNIEKKNFEDKEAQYFMKKGKAGIFEVKLSSGLTIKATKDHPFLTKKGMIQLKDLNQVEVAVSLFEGIEKEEVPKRLLIIARLAGYHFGDGTLYFIRKKGKICFFGTEKDLKVIQEDIAKLGFKSNIYSRQRNHKIRTQYGSKEFDALNFELHASSVKFISIMKGAGVPDGNKTRSEYCVPKWILNGPKSLKRQFLAGFFGAELTTASTSSKTGFYCQIVSMNKIEEITESGRLFLLQISELLAEFGIKVGKISERFEFENQYGEKTKRLRLIISAEENNLLKLWRNIGFEYNAKRARISEIASLYILKKKEENKRRKDLATKIKEYKSKGFKLNELQKLFDGQVNPRFIERHYYENAGQRISLKTISFNDFVKLKLEEFENFGCIFDEIASLKYAGEEEVYDLNVKDNHNFIANSFIVSNCGVRLIRTDWDFNQIKDKRKELLDVYLIEIPVSSN